MDQPTRVLLVEDDEDDFVPMKEMLSISGQGVYDLEWVETYQTAKDALSTRNHDICLLDYRLGAQDGLDLLREIRKKSDQPPVIMLTGQNDYDVDMEAMRIGASDYLVKGRIDPADLERSIRYAIAHGRLQEQIRESSALISLGTMAAGMANEINNPLTVVVGYSELLLQEDIPEAYKQRIQVISSEAQRAGKIITNLMRFAKKSDITKKYVELKPVLLRALELKSLDFKVNNIIWVDEFSPDLPMTLADEQQLLQVFINILTNAEQACQGLNGGGTLTIRALCLQDKIRISFNDDGPGIPQENLKKIFEPFFTTKEVGKGTGLGLSICHGIIRQHDGEMWAESELGTGSTIYVELPVLGQRVEESKPIEAAPQILANAIRILVVDDEPLVRDVVAHYLDQGCFIVDQAEGGEEAWRKLQSADYDCILLDLKMPGMNGQGLFKLILGSAESLANKVIFISGDSGNPDAQDFIAGTGNKVIQKPFKLEELHREVTDLVRLAAEKR